MFGFLLEYVASKPKHILPSLAHKVYPDPSPRGISLNVLKHSVVFHILQRALLLILVITTPPQSDGNHDTNLSLKEVITVNVSGKK